VAVLYNDMTLTQDDLSKFSRLKVVICAANRLENIDVKAAAKLGIMTDITDWLIYSFFFINFCNRSNRS